MTRELESGCRGGLIEHEGSQNHLDGLKVRSPARLHDIMHELLLTASSRSKHVTGWRGCCLCAEFVSKTFRERNDNIVGRKEDVWPRKPKALTRCTRDKTRNPKPRTSMPNFNTYYDRVHLHYPRTPECKTPKNVT